MTKEKIKQENLSMCLTPLVGRPPRQMFCKKTGEKIGYDRKINLFDLFNDPEVLECTGKGWIEFIDLMRKKGYSMRAIGEEIAEPILLAMIALESDHFTGGKIEWIKDQKDQETK